MFRLSGCLIYGYAVRLLDKLIFHAAAHLSSTRALSLRTKAIAYPSTNVMVKM